MALQGITGIILFESILLLWANRKVSIVRDFYRGSNQNGQRKK
jgi:hypothetical protein